MNPRFWPALVMLASTGCFYSPTGVDATASSDASSGASEANTAEASATAPASTGDPDPTTGGGDACGNAQIDEGEGCDNGAPNNGANGSICKIDCQLNMCGDGYAASTEGCDDGNVAEGDGCGADCKLEGCGDGMLKPPEECDDKNMIDGDGCSSLCKLPFCGDGTKDPGEQCDAGQDNLDTSLCTLGCKHAVCGDGLLLGGVEACDDGNQFNGDMCSANCSLEGCGDGEVQPGEECDDGNAEPGDGCSAICEKECGNGLLEPGEQCDDGNANLADTCDNSCARLRFHVFVTSAKYPADFGGLVEADKRCNMLATAAGLPGAGTFKAWLSTKVDGENPAERLFQSTKPYILTNNVTVAINRADLIDGNLNSPINLTETKQPALAENPFDCSKDLSGATFVWTDTTEFGTAAGSDCSNWTVLLGDQQGAVGMLNRKDSLWTNGCAATCDRQARFYCVEQPPA